MSKRGIAGAVIVLSVLPLTGRAQDTTDSKPTSSATTELFWQRTTTLVPIRMILPPGFTAQEPHTLIVALHGYGSSAERFRRVGERLAEAGFLVALPEATNAFMTEEGELGFDWGLYHTGDPALDRRAFELLITEYMSDVVRAGWERYGIERAYVLGFSQGAIAAVLSGIYLNDDFDGVISFGLGAYNPAWFWCRAAIYHSC
jgi:poly(3-hydroxybutyrate) depolymerase